MPRSFILVAALLLPALVGVGPRSRPAPRAAGAADLVVTPARSALVTGDTVVLEAVGMRPGSTLRWSSSNAAIASVSERGVVTANAVGGATITASDGEQRGEAQVMVSLPAVARVAIVPDSATIAPGELLQLSVRTTDAAGRAAQPMFTTWTSSDVAVASVSLGGLVSAGKAGRVRIAVLADGVRDTSVLVVAGSPRAAAPVASAATPRDAAPERAVARESAASAPAERAESAERAKSAESRPSAAARAANVPPGSLLPRTGGTWTGGTGALYASYSSTSPHWPQIRTMVTDFRVSYQPRSERAAEWDWIAANMDGVMSGSAAQYRRRNPTLRHFVYALNLTTFRPDNESASLGSGYARDMEAWARARGIPVERMYLHEAGRTDSAGRVVSRIWSSYRWWPNPGEPAVVAYNQDRMRRLMRETGSTGVFFDEHDSGTISKTLSRQPLAEYPTRAAYDSALVSLLRAERDTLRAMGATLLINTATYGSPLDWAMMRAAGGAHREGSNYIFNNSMPGTWSGIDRMLSEGITVEFVTALPFSDGKTLAPRGLTPGNSQSAWERAKLFELTSYYMVVDPARMDKLLVDFLSGNWSMPMSRGWIRSIEANIGSPTAERTVFATGTAPMRKDGSSLPYRVYVREFDRALVLSRPMAGWSATRYGDDTAVSIPLPDGETWVPLRADGTLAAPVRSIVLRNAEAAILVKGSQLGVPR